MIASGGAAFFAAVLTSFLNHVFVRRRERRRRLEVATDELVLDVPYVVGLIVEGGSDQPTGVGSLWHEKGERCRRNLNELRVLTRGRARGARARKLRTAAEDLAARLAAVQLRFMLKGQRPTPNEAFEVTGLDVYRAIYGTQETLDKSVQWYVKNGFTSGRPPTDAK